MNIFYIYKKRRKGGIIISKRREKVMGFKKYLKNLPKNSGFLIWSWIQLIWFETWFWG
ncbi:hypothetical protein SPAR73_1684 [Streptococcus pneumoniae GA41565]|nr:hypothetical protein SPAR73_1684 [Streptococcus pneumoniae GA41565]